MPLPMMQFMTRAVIVQRPIERMKGTPHPYGSAQFSIHWRRERQGSRLQDRMTLLNLLRQKRIPATIKENHDAK
jgi:hypothetical protein